MDDRALWSLAIHDNEAREVRERRLTVQIFDEAE